MFCPNCGTQNPDTAQNCSKCNFNIKGAAAPKFKGTMLMMNQPPVPGAPPPGVNPPPQTGAPPGQTPGVGPAGGAPRPAGFGGAPPPGAAGVPSKLKGTMVGVAPMAGGVGVPGPAPGQGPVPAAVPRTAPVPAAAPLPAGAPPPAPFQAPFQEVSSSFSPPVPQPGVNPLGGTVAADAGAFGAAFPGAPPPYGAPPGAGPPGAQPQFPPFGGAPPNPYGAPPPQYGAPPQQAGWGPPPQQQPPPGYGAPLAQPGGWGPPPQQAPYGAPPGAMAPYQGGAPLVGTLPSQGVKSVGPTRRNALMTLLLPFAVMFGSYVLGVVLIVLGLQLVGSLLCLVGSLGGAVWFLLTAIRMVSEVKFVTQNQGFAWWPIIVPFYQYYWLWILVPQEVTKAKQMLGVQQPPRSIILYIFLWPFALASDINDMVR